jgi:hypothetical protein
MTVCFITRKRVVLPYLLCASMQRFFHTPETGHKWDSVESAFLESVPEQWPGKVLRGLGRGYGKGYHEMCSSWGRSHKWPIGEVLLFDSNIGEKTEVSLKNA